MNGTDDTSPQADACVGSDNRTDRADIAYVVVPAGDIAGRIAQLADEIATCYRGGEITILAVLTGALVFLADLMRHLAMPLQVGVVSVSSYRAEATTPGDLHFRIPLADDLAGRDVLVLDDLLDTGQTLGALLSELARHRPASVRTCVLLRKDRPDLPDRMSADFVGFDVPNEFVVGYGLDHDRRYRNLPDICVLSCHAARPGMAPAEDSP